MSEIDAETLAQQVALLGLASRQEVKEAKCEADDGSFEALARVFLRRQLLTRWQLDRLQKGEASGFFIGGCKILFHIAEGTFARVYRAVKVPGGQTVAVKIMRQRFASDAGAVDRFNKEAEAGIRLAHPNIVRTYEYGEDDGRHYMTMEFVEGSNLRDFLKVRSRLNETEALPMMIGLSSALKYSIEHGITHRDIKGTNILIASNGTAKLVDFGLAGVEGDEKKMASAHGQRTVDYSALERTCGSPKGDPRSDIFFLGCVFYQMLTGQLPLPEVETSDPLAKMLKRGINSIKPLHEQRYAPSPELCAIVEKMMKVELRSRYQSMDEVVSDLERYAKQQASHNQFEKLLDSALGKGANGGKGAATLEDDDFEVELHEPSQEFLLTRPRNVLCVEVQEQIQRAFRKTLTEMGYKVILVGDAERGAERYRESASDAVIFDVDGLGPNSIDSLLDMCAKADEEKNTLRAVVLLGPRQHGLAQRLPASDHVIVLQKPLKMKQVQEAILRLLPNK